MKPTLHRWTLWLLPMLLIGIAGCDDDDTATVPAAGLYDLNFAGTIAPHANQMLRALVIKDADGSVVANGTTTVGGDGSFNLSWPDLLEANMSYRVDFYADHNGDGDYDTPPTDHAWRLALGTVTADVTTDFQHSTDFTDVEDSFEFALAFSAALAPHAGQNFRVAIVEQDSGETVATDAAVVASDGSVAFTWPDVLEEGHDYHIDFYADHNGNGQCDAPPADHAWRIALSDVRGDLSEEFAHNTSFTEVCGSFAP